MSFILDALRKSEHERRRGALPGVAQVPFALPRARLPRWVPAAIGALALALGVTGFAWWYTAGRAAPDGSPRLAAARAPQAAPPAVAAPTPRQAAEREPSVTAPPRVGDPPPWTGTAAPEHQAPVLVPGNTPLAEPETRPAERSPDAAAAPATRTAALPGPSALAAAGIDVPPLMLQLHVYDSDSAKRFVIINGRRYAEGARLNEGPELVTIEKRGVVLRQQGRDFLLLPE
jgi:general secretion pathway protein B